MPYSHPSYSDPAFYDLPEPELPAGVRPFDRKRGDDVGIGYVWTCTPGTMVLAMGWQVSYLRLLYNPVRRALRFCGYVFMMVLWRPERGEAWNLLESEGEDT